MQKEWKPDIPPVMLTDDIAFVGGTPVSSHCILAKDGLILLDTGYPGMLDGIAANMKALGLDIMDVKYILHSHGHIDHYGSTAELLRKTGAKSLIGREDADIVTGKRDLSWAKELELAPAECFTPDILFSDGDVLQLGGKTIRCVHAPGHTEGTYALFVNTSVHGTPMVAAMHGGVGVNSLSRKFLDSYGLPRTLRDQFREGLYRLAREHVDIVLGNHPGQNDTEGKISRMRAGSNPFVDSGEWNRFLTSCEARLDDLLRQEADER